MPIHKSITLSEPGTKKKRKEKIIFTFLSIRPNPLESSLSIKGSKRSSISSANGIPKCTV